MEILKIYTKNPDKKIIQKTVAILRSGGVIVYPTDTAYALGGFYDSKKVINKILKIKNRKDNKFTLIAADLNQVKKFFKLNPLQRKLAKKYWPGPLSIVISSKQAVRVPKNKIAVNLAKKAGRPLIATSANISGGQTLYDSKKIINQFKNKKNPRLLHQRVDSARQEPDLILAAGRLRKVKTSTIVYAAGNKVKILRQGEVKING